MSNSQENTKKPGPDQLSITYEETIDLLAEILAPDFLAHCKAKGLLPKDFEIPAAKKKEEP